MPDIFDIFLITGQSNASGAHDSAKDEDTLRECAVAPNEGNAYCLNVDSRGRHEGEYYDLSVGRDGFSPALAKRWNELTGRGVFVVQTAVAGSPIQRWAVGECPYPETGKNLLDNTIDAANYVLSLGEGENPKFKFGDIYYFWCQGETGQAHEWLGDEWLMPGINLINTDTYYKKFMSYHYGLLSKVKVRAGAIMLVRTLPRISTKKSLELGLLTDNNPAKAAQYMAHAENGGTLRIMSRISEIARLEDTPGLGAAYVWSDNVHYRKKGYNHHGRELAENLYRWMNPQIDKTPTGLEWFEPDCRTRMRNGSVLKVDAVRGAMTSACVLPLWADDTRLSFEITDDPSGSCELDKYGTIKFREGTPVGTKAKVKCSASAGYSIEITAECAEPAPFNESENGVVTDFIWDFTKGNLLEYNQYNNLTPDYDVPQFVSEGLIPCSPMIPSKPVIISDKIDWSLEWKGTVPGEYRLFGGGASRIDTNLGEGKKILRYRSAEGNIFEFPYEKQGDSENLKLEYNNSERNFTLYCDGKAAYTVKADKPFSSKFDEILHRNKNAVIEYVKITAFVER